VTVLGLYLQPDTASRLEQLASDTGAKRSDLVTRLLALAMEKRLVIGPTS
jgi:predicted transcriptional regulator